MRRLPPLLILGLGLSLALPAAAQTGDSAKPATDPTAAGPAADTRLPPAPNTGRNVSATGRVMPPTTGRNPALGADPLAKPADPRTAAGKAGKAETAAARSPGALKPATEAEMIKAQKAAEARNKAWDTRMRRTMSSICSGC